MRPHGSGTEPSSISLSLLPASLFTFIRPLPFPSLSLSLLQSPFQCLARSLSPPLHFHPLFPCRLPLLFLDITPSIALPLKKGIKKRSHPPIFPSLPPSISISPSLSVSAALMHGKQWMAGVEERRRRRMAVGGRKKRVINVFEKKINNHRRLGAGSWP